MARSIEQMVGILIEFGFGLFLTSLSILFLVVVMWILTHWNG